VRCSWVERGSPLDVAYHDTEWGVPSRDDGHLFEMLVLEGAQAGLSWSTILRKREHYRRAFAGFDPRRVAAFDARMRRRLLADAGIVRHAQKIEAAVRNARGVLDIQGECGSLATFLWSFVDGKPLGNAWRTGADIPVATDESRAMSRALVARGFTFVGPTICYAFMQAVGMVNDHLVGCFRHRQVQRAGRRARGARPGL
jgi:DNA-3-methyladenine glycosylase I